MTLSVTDLRDAIESLRPWPKSTLARGDSGELVLGTDAPAPHPAIEKRFMMLASPVSWGTSRGNIAAALAGPYVEAVAVARLSFAAEPLDSVGARETWFC